MRVISGIYRSRVLKEVELDSTRSTKDRVKESMFNSLSNHVVESDVLDLFAGSGALGIEALSRGANKASFNELNKKAYKVITDNIKTLGISDFSLSQKDYMDFLISTEETYDLILLDPPYHMEVLDSIIKLIASRKLLNKGGIIVSLYAKNNSLKKENNGIIEYKKKTIGITNVSFMKWGI